MKNLTKSLLVTLMLIGFSFNAFSTVDCEGLSKVSKATYKARNFSEVLRETRSQSSEHSRCLKFNQNYPNASWDYIDKITGTKRIQGERWDGISSSNSTKTSAQKTKVVAKKSYGKRISELTGFYAVIEEYGMKDGLVKIREYWSDGGWPPINLVKIEEYLTSISWAAIKQGAEKFAMADILVKFLRAQSY